MQGDLILAELKKIGKQLTTIGNLVHGLYRHSKGAPVQPPIPGLVADDSPMPPAGEIARSMPRQWCNTVRVWEALWELFGAETFFADALFEEKARASVREATDGRVRPQTAARMLTALVRAGAAQRLGRGAVRLSEPTDERREAVEREADKLNAHKAKEPAHA